MRVAYVCADAGVPVFGTKGCSVHVQEIIKQLLACKHAVTLFAVRLGGQSCFQSPNFRLEELVLAAAETVADRENLQLQAAKQIAIRLATEKIDLVYERYSLWSCASILQAKRLGVPSILEVNSPLIEEQEQHRQLVHRSEAVSIRNMAFLEATSIIAVSDAIATYVREQLPSSEHSKVHTVPNGVDTDRFSPVVEPYERDAQFTVGFLGTLKPWHGLESLLKAFHLAHQQRPKLKLRIIGDGPLRDSLQQLVERDMPSIRTSLQWIGAVHPQDVPRHLTALDVAIAPYVDAANFYFSPLKVYEYMAAGRAIIASSIGQLETVLQHDRNGLLYEPGDIGQLATHICQLADHPTIVKRLGAAARQDAQLHHSWQHTLQVIMEHSTLDQASASRLVLPATTKNHQTASQHNGTCELRS